MASQIVQWAMPSSTCPPLVQEAQPLLQQSIKLVGEVTPLLAELREGGLVNNVEALTATAAAAAADIQKLQVDRKAMWEWPLPD